ncbi:hypothetical protein CR513_29885, partial [Mucuna pruriens]
MRSSTDPLYDLDPEIEINLRRLRKARTIVVHNSNSSGSVSDNSSHVINTFDSIEYSSTNNFSEPEQMENNDRTLKELATPDVVYQPWCVQYPQLEPAQSYELSLQALKRIPCGLYHNGVARDTEGLHQNENVPISLDGAANDWLYLQPVLFNT